MNYETLWTAKDTPLKKHFLFSVEEAGSTLDKSPVHQRADIK